MHENALFSSKKIAKIAQRWGRTLPPADPPASGECSRLRSQTFNGFRRLGAPTPEPRHNPS